MSEASSASAIAPPREGQPATLVRIFGWSTLTVLAAYMINNVLVVAFGWPGAFAAFSGGGSSAALQAALYAAAVAAAVAYVLASRTRALRWDAKIISDFNAFIIRGCFWAVVFVGIADAAIAFMRIEHLLGVFFPEDMIGEFGRARFMGYWVHVPLIALGFLLAIFTRTLGFTWLALLIVAAELLIVISRFVFSYEQAFMGDLVRYWYAALFLFASAYTLLEDGHVRVDVLYAGFGRRTKGFVNAIGTILLGMTTMWVIIALGFGGPAAIINSPVANFEVSQTGGTGMFVKYHMAGFLGIFAVTMLIQFTSFLLESVADYRDEPGHRDTPPVEH